MNLLSKIRTLPPGPPAPGPPPAEGARAGAIGLDGDGGLASACGGRAEWAAAARGLVEEGANPEETEEEALAARLYEPDMPDPDLLIRTSGELRVSNFLLWQLAYAELVFVDTLWPDFGEADLRSALEDYARRRRRFGGR